jgi:GT2 family glycosyltransferase
MGGRLAKVLSAEGGDMMRDGPMHPGPDLSVVIVTRDRPDDLEKCLVSLENASGGRIAEVIVVDDASTNPPVLSGRSLRVTVVYNKKRSFLSQSRNIGCMRSLGSYIMFIDDDNIVDVHAIEELSANLDADPLCMVASPVICYTSQPKRIWFAGGWLAPVSALFVAAFRGRDVASLPKMPYQTELFHDAFMVKREAFEQVGYFDEKSFPMYLSEADFAARLKEKGFSAAVVPAARIWHSIAPLEGRSSLLRGIHITEPVRAYFVGRNRLLYMRRHANLAAFLLHVAVFEPVLISIHLFAMLSGPSRGAKTRLFGPYLRGVFDGLVGRVRMGHSIISSPG